MISFSLVRIWQALKAMKVLMYLAVVAIPIDGVDFSTFQGIKYTNFKISKQEEKRAEMIYSKEIKGLYSFTDPKSDHKAAAKYFDKKKLNAFSIHAFQAAIQYDDSSSAWNNLGVALLRGNKRIEARQAFERAIWLDANNDDAYDNLDSLLLASRSFNNSQQIGRPQYIKKHVRENDKYWSSHQLQQESSRTSISIKSGEEFFDFLSSTTFRTKYFERFPVLLHSSKETFQWAHSLERVLDDWYKVGNGGYTPPFRNINFLKESLISRNGEKGLPIGWGLRSGLIKALKMGYSLQLLHAEHWVRSLSRFVLSIIEASQSVSSTNIYITPPGHRLATPPHVDFTGSWMVQLNGRKKWKLWVKKDVMLPVYKRHIIGRDEDDKIDEAMLGKPTMEVILKPGDLLWVPRGCIHSTTTENSIWNDDGVKDQSSSNSKESMSEAELLRKTSMHLTTHLARLHDFGGMEQILLTALNGNENSLFESRWTDTVNDLLEEDIEYRRGINFYEKNWKENIKEKMHKVVDKMLDDTDYLDAIELQSTLSIIRRSNILKSYVKLNNENYVIQKHKMPGDELPENMLIESKNQHFVNESIGIDKYNIDPFGPTKKSKWEVFDAQSAPSVCKGKKWLKMMVPKKENDEHEVINITYTGSNISPKIYGPNSPDVLKIGVDDPLHFTCVYASTAGACKAVNRHNARKATHPTTAIILVQYKRFHHLKSILSDLHNQISTGMDNDEGFDLYIMNNNAKNSQRCKMEYEIQKFLTKVIKKRKHKSKNQIRTIWTHHSPVNVGPKISIIGANSLSHFYERFIFLDDDVKSSKNMVKNMVQNEGLNGLKMVQSDIASR